MAKGDEKKWSGEKTGVARDLCHPNKYATVYIDLFIYSCMYVSIYIYICLSISRSIYLSIYLSIPLCIYLSIYRYRSMFIVKIN